MCVCTFGHLSQNLMIPGSRSNSALVTFLSWRLNSRNHRRWLQSNCRQSWGTLFRVSPGSAHPLFGAATSHSSASPQPDVSGPGLEARLGRRQYLYGGVGGREVGRTARFAGPEAARGEDCTIVLGRKGCGSGVGRERGRGCGLELG
jgi:hypothetical protein